MLPRIIISIFLVGLLADAGVAQSDLVDTLKSMDRNQNRMIDPDEVTTMARAYFEKLSNSGSSRTRLNLDKPIPISYLLNAIREYQAVRNGASYVKVEPDEDRQFGVQPFGLAEEEPMVPGFGFGELRHPYAQADLDFADRTMSSHDENKDGYIDMKEAERHEWTHRQPFLDDLNQDNRLSRLELAQRYARRRMLEQSADNLRKQAWRKGEFRPPTPSTPKSSRRNDDSMWWRTGGSDYWLTASLLGRFDKDKNGKLEEAELESIGIPKVYLDPNRDNVVTREELFAYIKKVQDEAGGSAEGPPAWFDELDADRDGQLTIPEFAAEELTDARIAEFESKDSNGDGLLTTSEVVGAANDLGTAYTSSDGELLPPRKTIVSEIEITDDFVISELKLQLFITHTYTSKLDGYLSGPDGQRIELFTAVGGSDDHFRETLFDDSAEQSIAKGRPPFTGAFRPEGVDKKLPGLDHYVGTNAKGTWQLIIRCSRSERFGVLNRWTIFTKSQ